MDEEAYEPELEQPGEANWGPPSPGDWEATGQPPEPEAGATQEQAREATEEQPEGATTASPNREATPTPLTQWVYRSRYRQLMQEQTARAMQSKTHDKQNNRRATQQISKQQWGLRCEVEGEQTVPEHITSTDRSHKLWMTGGIIFCSRCGSLRTADRKSRLQDTCKQVCPPGSLPRLRHMLAGKLPIQLKSQGWPDGLTTGHTLRLVFRIYYNRGRQVVMQAQGEEIQELEIE